MARTSDKRSFDEVSSGSSYSGTGVKRTRFSIDTLLDARINSPDEEESLPNTPLTEERVPPILLPDAGSQSIKKDPQLKGDALDGIECRLEGSELWAKFFELGTEMIITKSGRWVYLIFMKEFSKFYFNLLVLNVLMLTKLESMETS
uniref:T-box domain-containing protein n=1 Tax=Heterorhabditis bacteriophora TaxID=37862 RepID=A0A1I7WXC7_HETBA